MWGEGVYNYVSTWNLCEQVAKTGLLQFYFLWKDKSCLSSQKIGFVSMSVGTKDKILKSKILIKNKWFPKILEIMLVPASTTEPKYLI